MCTARLLLLNILLINTFNAIGMEQSPDELGKKLTKPTVRFSRFEEYIALGANLNFVNPVNHFTPLVAAVWDNNTTKIKALLDANADVNKQNYRGLPPLGVAATRGSPAVLSMLITRGADLYYADKDGAGVLVQAVYAKNTLNTRILLEEITKLTENDKQQLNHAGHDDELNVILTAHILHKRIVDAGALEATRLLDIFSYQFKTIGIGQDPAPFRQILTEYLNIEFLKTIVQKQK